jgi:mRNA interferase MazF
MAKVGEIVLSAFPFSDLTGTKRRPCVILAEAETAGDFIVAFITSGYASRFTKYGVVLDPSHPDWKTIRLKAPSVVRVDRLCTLNLRLFSGRVGVLPTDIQASVQQKIKALFGV